MTTPHTDPTTKDSAALADVLKERARQDAKWGEQNNDPFCYLVVLMEEVGELSQAALHSRFGGRAAEKLREEAVHTAAVALAIVECLDRDKWQWPISHQEAKRIKPSYQTQSLAEAEEGGS